MTEDVSAGTLYVGVEGDTTGLGREVQRRIDAEMARVRARVQVEVDSRRLQTDLNRSVREARASIKVPVTVDRQQLARDLKAAISYAQRSAGKATVEVDADTSAATAKIDETTRKRSVTVDADADTAAAEAQIDTAARNRTAKVKVEIDSSSLLSGSMAVVSLMKFPAIAAGINLAGAAVVQLGAGLVSLVSAAAPAVNLLGLLPAAGAALASGLAPVITAFSGVGDAVKAMSNQQKTAGTQQATLAAQQEAAAQRVVSAQRAVRDAHETANEAAISGARQVQSAEATLAAAQRSSRDAQVALTQARQDAADRLESYNDQLVDAALNERGAQLAVERAAQRLNEVNHSATSTSLDRREAQLAYDEAIQRQKELVKHNKDLASEAKKASKAGVEGDAEVIDAKRGVADAARSERDAEVALSDARRQAANANRDAIQNVQEANEQLTIAVRAQSRATDKQTAGYSAEAAALATLSPAGRRFARFITDTLKPALSDLHDTAQEAFLPPLQQGLTAAMDVLPHMDRLLRKTGGVMGNVAKNALEMVSSGPWLRDFDTITDSSTRTLKSLGGALNPLLRVVRDLTVAGGPFIEEFAKAIKAGSKALSEFIGEQREIGEADPSKGLSGFFQRAVDAGKMLWDLIKDLAGAIYNIGQAAAPAGRILFESLDKAVEKLKGLTEPGSEGGNKLKQYFLDAVPSIQAMGRFFNGVVIALGKIGGNKQTAALFDQMTTELLPAVTDALMSMGEAFGPAFISLLTDVAKVFADIGGGGGGLAAAAKALDAIFKALHAVLGLPGIGPLVQGLLGIVGAATGIGLAAGAMSKLGKNVAKTIGYIPGVKRLANHLMGVDAAGNKTGTSLGSKLATGAKKAGSALATAAKASLAFVTNVVKAGAAAAVSGAKFLVARVRVLALKAAQLIAAAASKVMAAAQILLNIAMSANPITLIIIALIALGVALVLLWKKSETFRKIVTGAFNAVKSAAETVFNWIKKHWPLLLAILTGPFGLAVLAIIKNWDKIKHVFTASFNWVKDKWSKFWTDLKRGAEIIFGKVKDAITGIWDKIKHVFSAAWDWVKGKWTGFWNDLKRGTEIIFGKVKSVITDVLDKIKDAFHTAVGAIKKIWHGLEKATRVPVEFVVNTVYNKGIRWVWNKVGGLVGLPELPEAHFAKGGVIPGYAPGRDSVRIWASPGEGVLVPEAVRGLGGEGAIHAINHSFSSRVPAGPAQQSKGGSPAFGIGGVLGGGWDKVKGAGGAVVSGVGYVAGAALEAIRKGAAAAIAAMLGPVRGLLHSILDGTQFTAALVAAFDTVIDKVVSTIRGSSEESPPPEGKAGGGVIGGMPSKRDRVQTWLRPGEGILTPETTSALGGASGIAALNNNPIRALLAASRAAGGSAPIFIDRSVTFEEGAIQVDNPVAEPASDSINSRMRRLAEMGVFG